MENKEGMPDVTTLFAQWTEEQLDQIVTDCRQARVGMQHEVVRHLNLIRTVLVAGSHWGNMTEEEFRTHVGVMVASATRSIDTLLAVPAVAPVASVKQAPLVPQPQARTEEKETVVTPPSVPAKVAKGERGQKQAPPTRAPGLPARPQPRMTSPAVLFGAREDTRRVIQRLAREQPAGTTSTLANAEELLDMAFALKERTSNFFFDLVASPSKAIPGTRVPDEFGNPRHIPHRPLSSPGEALFLVENVIVAQLHQRWMEWADADKYCHLKAYLYQHPEHQLYDLTVTDPAEIDRRWRRYRETRGPYETDESIDKRRNCTAAWMRESLECHGSGPWMTRQPDQRGKKEVIQYQPIDMPIRLFPISEELDMTRLSRYLKHFSWASHIEPDFRPEYLLPPGVAGRIGHRVLVADMLIAGAVRSSLLGRVITGQLPWVITAPFDDATDLNAARHDEGFFHNLLESTPAAVQFGTVKTKGGEATEEKPVSKTKTPTSKAGTTPGAGPASKSASSKGEETLPAAIDIIPEVPVEARKIIGLEAYWATAIPLAANLTVTDVRPGPESNEAKDAKEGRTTQADVNTRPSAMQYRLTLDELRTRLGLVAPPAEGFMAYPRGEDVSAIEGRENLPHIDYRGLTSGIIDQLIVTQPPENANVNLKLQSPPARSSGDAFDWTLNAMLRETAREFLDDAAMRPLSKEWSYAQLEPKVLIKGEDPTECNLRYYMMKMCQLNGGAREDKDKDKEIIVERLLARLLGLYAYEPLMQAVRDQLQTPTAFLSLPESAQLAVKELLKTIMTYEILQTCFTRLASPAAGTDIAGVDQFKQHAAGQLELRVLAIITRRLLGELELRLPPHLYAMMTEIGWVFENGGYGPCDWSLNGSGGSRIALPMFRDVLFTLDTAGHIGRLGIYQALIVEQMRRWYALPTLDKWLAEKKINDARAKFGPKAEAPTPSLWTRVTTGLTSIYNRMTADADVGLEMEATMANDLSFVRQVQVTNFNLFGNLAAMLGHLHVGVACYASYFDMYGLFCDPAIVGMACAQFALTNGIPAPTAIALQEVAHTTAAPNRLGPYALLPSTESGLGAALQVIEWLSSPRGRRAYNGQMWLVDNVKKERHGSHVRAFVERLYEIAYEGPRALMTLSSDVAPPVDNENEPAYSFVQTLLATTDKLRDDLVHKNNIRLPTEEEKEASAKWRAWISDVLLPRLPLDMRLNGTLLKHGLRTLLAQWNLL